MRIGCLQFAPQVGDVDNNLNRADAVLNKADPQDLDLLVLPELAFSGYNFKSLEQISSFLEPSGSGISALWARTTALKYDCHVAVGYPEKIDPTTNWPTSPEYYNSALIVNGDGETVANYRKNHLYYTDETWALEGNNGFYEGYIPGLGHTAIGICMDLNPYKFEAPWDDFEFAYHVLECQSNVVIVSMAWMTREDPRMFTRMPNEPDMDTLTYWVTRLEPLIRMEDDDEIIVIFANRSGIEGDTVYAGTSAVVGIQDGEVRVYGVLGRGEKELLVVDTNTPPQAKLVYRPGGESNLAHGELQPSEPPTSPKSSRSKQSQPSSQRQSTASIAPPAAQAAQTSPTHVASPAITSSSQHKRRERPKPQLQIPVHPSQQTANASATSTKSMADDIPTPSAPSPTPHNMRPKITIPESSQQPSTWQALSPVPMSAQSAHSVQSVQSNVSSSSRRPEDSTPYPHGSDPYNSPRFGTIYGGDVTITRKGFSPITPFDDASPVAMRHGWPGGSVADSIAESAVQSSVGMSSARQRPRRAFQDWPQLQPRQENAPQPPGGGNQVASQQPKRASPSKQTEVGHSSVAGVEKPQPSPPALDRQSNKTEDPQPSGSTKLPIRPSSPKSRNASRTGNRERSDSALGQHSVEVDIDQLLETITRRAESVNRSRNKDTASPYPGRPSSRRAHARSSSRPTEATASIVIGANPAVLGQEIPRSQTESVKTGPRGPPRTTSRLGHRARSASLSDGSQLRARSRTPAHHDTSPEVTSRGVSRGRKPGPHGSASVQSVLGASAETSRPGSAMAQRKVSSSQQVGVDSPRAGSVRSRNHLVSRHAKLDPSADSPRSVEGSRHQTPSRHGSGPGTPSLRSIAVDHDTDQPTICPNCSTEIPCSSKPSPRAINTSFGDPKSSPRQPSRRPLHIAEMTSERSTSLDSRASLPESFVVVSESESLAETLETTSTTGGSPATPDFMDPCTPKAMVFIRDADDGKPNPPSPDDKGPSPVCVMKEIVV